MSRRIDPTYYSNDEDGWEYGRHGDDQGEGRNRLSNRRRQDTRKHAYGRAKGSRRRSEGWDRFDAV